MWHTCKYFLDESEQHFLEVEAEITTDITDWPFQEVVEINAVSLDGLMSIKLDEIPADLRKALEDHIIQKQKVEHEWETQ